MKDLIDDFMSQKRFAIVGASGDPHKYGYQIFKNLRERGYEVYPVNPRLAELEGVKCYPSLHDIPVRVDVVDIVVSPKVTDEVVKEANELGLKRIWLQPGAESDAAIEFCQSNGLKVVHSVCVMLSGPRVLDNENR